MQKLHEAHPIELAAVDLLALGWALMAVARLLLVPAVALLLTLAGWRPAAPAAAAVTAGTERAPTPAPAPVTASTSTGATAAQPAVTAASPVPPLTAAPLTLADLAQPAAATLELLTVAQLRQRGRAAGLPRALTRSGRRLELLTALAALEPVPNCLH